MGVHRAAAILVQVSLEDAKEAVHSGKQMENGATLRVALALRNTIFTHAEGGKLNPELRIVLQMVYDDYYFFLPFFVFVYLFVCQRFLHKY